MANLAALKKQVSEEGGAGGTSFRTVRERVGALMYPTFPSATPPFRVHADDAWKKALSNFQAKSSVTAFSVPTVPTIAYWRASLPTLRPAAQSIGFAHIRAVAISPAIDLRVHRVGFPTVPRFTGFQLSPEVVAWVRARIALGEGDATLFWRFVEDQLGGPPDDLLRGVLDKYFLSHADGLPSWVILDLLDHHRRRLNWNKQYPAASREWHDWLADQVYRRLRKNPNHRLIKALEHYPESPYKRLRLELPLAVAQAEQDGFFGGYFGNPYSWHNRFMLGDVEKQIVHANRLLKDTRSRRERNDDKWINVVPLDLLSPHEEEQFLATADLEDESEEFARLEEERWERRRDELSKMLSPKEQELIQLIRFLRDNPEKHDASIYQTVGRRLGKAPSTVRRQILNIKRYLAS
jgi:hypothetical protein